MESFYAEQRNLWLVECVKGKSEHMRLYYPEWKCRLQPERMLLKRTEYFYSLKLQIPSWVEECREGHMLNVRPVPMEFLELTPTTFRDYQRFIREHHTLKEERWTTKLARVRYVEEFGSRCLEELEAEMREYYLQDHEVEKQYALALSTQHHRETKKRKRIELD